MARTSPADVIARLHVFGVERDRMRSALAGLLALPSTDLDALDHLERHGPLTQRELGEKLLLTSGAVTMVVDRLELRGLATRRPNPADRRSALVELAADPLPDVAELLSFHRSITAAAGALPAAQRAHVITFLETAAEHAATATAAMRSRTRPRPGRPRTGGGGPGTRTAAGADAQAT